MSSLLVVFTRYPEPGIAKTRLIPALGAHRAAALHRRMTEHTMLRAVPPDSSLEVRYAGGSKREMRAWLGTDIPLCPQGEGNLGDRIARAFAGGFDAGYDCVAVIGADCPDLDADIVRRAFKALVENDLVLGPATDGGYYLIALSADAWGRVGGSLFQDIDWGNASVLDQSLEVAKASGLAVFLIETLRDVDRPEDLPVWERWKGKGD